MWKYAGKMLEAKDTTLNEHRAILFLLKTEERDIFLALE